MAYLIKSLQVQSSKVNELYQNLPILNKLDTRIDLDTLVRLEFKKEVKGQ